MFFTHIDLLTRLKTMFITVIFSIIQTLELWE